MIAADRPGRWAVLLSREAPGGASFAESLRDGEQIVFGHETHRGAPHHIVDVATAERALEHLHRTCDLDPGLTWWSNAKVNEHLVPREVQLNVG